MNQDIHDLAPAYALGALDDDDRVEFEKHLRSCRDCQQRVEAMAKVTEEVAWDYGAIPPDRVRESVMASLDSTPQEVASTKPTTVAPLVRRRRWVPFGIAAAITALSLLGWSLLGSGRVLDAILADPNAISIEATPTEDGQGVFSNAEIVYSPEHHAGALIIEGLQAVGDDRTYELWLILETGPVPAGTFRPAPDGRATVLLDGEVRPGTVVALTEEVAGGVEAPTGAVLLTAEITA
jgi:anti-sigma-K factor RskA